jgi:hypothetical protein
MRADAILMKVTLLLGLAAASVGFAQNLPRTMDWGYAPCLVTGAPFTATWREIFRDHGKVTSQTTVQMARASDGSIYSAILSPEGMPLQVEIDDVPNNRMITVNAVTHTYSLSTPDGGKFRTFSVQQFTELVQKWEEMNFERPPFRVTSLGVKQDSGMTLYGQKAVASVPDEDIHESWMSSDLGVKAASKEIRHPSEFEVVGALGDIRHEEPDPKLFRVPEGYAQIRLPSP